MNNSNLEFRKIPSLKFLYEVNSNGTIIRNVKSKKQLKIRLDMHHSTKGYYATFVHIGGRKEGNKRVRVMMHKVVAECFLGECPEGLQVDHIDRNSHNNDYRNLRYATHSEQMKNRTLSEETIERCKRNCQAYVARISKPVVLTNKDERFTLKSLSAAARFLAQKTGTKFEHCRSKLKKRRKHIYGFDVEYLNAETIRQHSTE